MNDALLSGALALCLGGGALDVVALNLVALPAARAPLPSERPPPTPARPALFARSAASIAAELSPLPVPAQSGPTVAARPVMIVEFEVSSPRVSRHESRALLEAVAQLSRASAITVIGHADESGPEALNDRLSAQRAAAVLERLEASGIPRRRLQLQARGEREPRTDGNSRRVEIFVGGPP